MGEGHSKEKARGCGLKHQKEKRSMDHFAGLDVSGPVVTLAGRLKAYRNDGLSIVKRLG